MTLNDHLVIQTEYKNVFSKKDAKTNIPVYSDKKVKCEICGLESGSIASHIYQTHNMPISEYKDIFNVDKVTSDDHRMAKSKIKCEKYPEFVDEHVSEFFAHVNANYVSPIDSGAAVFVFNGNQSSINRIKFLLNSVFGINVDSEISDNGQSKIEFSCFMLKDFIKLNCKDVFYKTDSVPQIVRTSSKESVISYLKTFIDYRAMRRSNIRDRKSTRLNSSH